MTANSKKQLSNDIREKIIQKYISGKSTTRISDELDIHCSTINNVLRIYKTTMRIESISIRAPKVKKITVEIATFIKNAIDEDVSVTLDVLQNKILTLKNILVSKSTINRAISEFNYSFKRVVLIPERRNSAENIELRYNYSNEYLLLNEDKIIFLDEMGVICSMRCSYGRSIRGTSPRKTVRSIRSQNYSVSAAITKTGVLFSKTLPHAFNGERYCEFITEVLSAMNDNNLTAFTLIMDNCTIHKVQSVRRLIQESGNTLIFLPPYSPQLNPIEEFFSKWKNNIRTQNSRNVEELQRAIQAGTTNFTESDCLGYFSHVRFFALKGVRREEF